MISEEVMRFCNKRKIRLVCKNDREFITCPIFQAPQYDDEEPMLDFENYLISQSEIKTIEFLD